MSASPLQHTIRRFASRFCPLVMSKRVFQKHTFTTVPDLFTYGDPSLDPTKLPAVAENFGAKVGWSSIVEKLNDLNKSEDGSIYKLLFVGRHGQGTHNVAEAKYGTKAWDEHWSLLTGDGDLVWGPDPPLTALGQSQAADVHVEWSRQVELAGQGKDHAPYPTRLLCSPFTRAAQTLVGSLQGIFIESVDSGAAKGQTELAIERPLVPFIMEGFRETYGEHTCDQRSTKSHIARTFPSFEFEEGFDEEDLLYKPDERETEEHIVARIRDSLSVVWTYEKEHTGRFIRRCGHREGKLVLTLGPPSQFCLSLPTQASWKRSSTQSIIVSSSQILVV